MVGCSTFRGRSPKIQKVVLLKALPRATNQPRFYKQHLFERNTRENSFQPQGTKKVYKIMKADEKTDFYTEIRSLIRDSISSSTTDAVTSLYRGRAPFQSN
jgi:hypothetical protein